MWLSISYIVHNTGLFNYLQLPTLYLYLRRAMQWCFSPVVCPAFSLPECKNNFVLVYKLIYFKVSFTLLYKNNYFVILYAGLPDCCTPWSNRSLYIVSTFMLIPMSMSSCMLFHKSLTRQAESIPQNKVTKLNFIILLLCSGSLCRRFHYSTVDLSLIWHWMSLENSEIEKKLLLFCF